MRQVDFYTDGSYSSKTQFGGWASICLEDGMIIDTQSGYEPYSSNNRMELTAFLSALENADTIETGNTHVTVYTDSAYVANALNNNWYTNWMHNGWRTADRQKVKNQDLWGRIISLYIKLKKAVNLKVVKVAGHTGNKWNEYVNDLAIKKRNEFEEKDKELKS